MKTSALKKISKRKDRVCPVVLLPTAPPIHYEASNEEEMSFTGSAPEHLGAKKSVETLYEMRVNTTVEKLFPPSHYQKGEVGKGD